jgi:ATP-dependent helicase YprA (DUF1998 family)
MQFKTLTGHEPYPHQVETYEALAKIRSPLPLWERDRVRGTYIILRAPTGSGKSEAVFVPFVVDNGIILEVLRLSDK